MYHAIRRVVNQIVRYILHRASLLRFWLLSVTKPSIDEDDRLCELRYWRCSSDQCLSMCHLVVKRQYLWMGNASPDCKVLKPSHLLVVLPLLLPVHILLWLRPVLLLLLLLYEVLIHLCKHLRIHAHVIISSNVHGTKTSSGTKKLLIVHITALHLLKVLSILHLLLLLLLWMWRLSMHRRRYLVRWDVR